ncbi:hypothetical protein DL763_004353 [Monosporascus cannonballus]|nr:hypothetical protein DL763_004353 [Monosporascus cannonballus]
MTLPSSVLLTLLLAVEPSKVLALPTEDSILPTPTASKSFATPHFEPVSEIETNEPIRGSGPPPAKFQKDEWDIVEYYEADGGFTTAYAPTDAEAFSALVGINVTESVMESLERCGGRRANLVKCWSGQPRGTASACEYLWQQLSLQASNGRPTLRDVRIPSRVRHVCRGDTGGECCTTWGHQGSDVYYGHLAQAVQDTFFCISNGIFARVENVIIGGGPCTHQCVTGQGGNCPPYNGNT